MRVMVLVVLAMVWLFGVTDGGRLIGISGRPPVIMDHILCKVQLFKQVDSIQETQDPRGLAEAYFNKSGQPCKTYCRVRSVYPEISKAPQIYDSPQYIYCGIDRYCTKGKCKRIGSSIESEESTTNANVKEQREIASVTRNSAQLITGAATQPPPSTSSPHPTDTSLKTPIVGNKGKSSNGKPKTPENGEGNTDVTEEPP